MLASTFFRLQCGPPRSSYLESIAVRDHQIGLDDIDLAEVVCEITRLGAIRDIISARHECSDVTPDFIERCAPFRVARQSRQDGHFQSHAGSPPFS
jgi:hypothetical protein